MKGEIKLLNLLVTGTPGVDKTSFSMLLTDNLNQFLSNSAKQFNYINIGKIIIDKKLYTDWNKEFDVPEFDEDKVMDELEPLLEEGGCVLDFHSSFFLPESLVDLVVLIRCDNTILYDRLFARGYSEKKIKENIECEIMEVTSEEVREGFPENKIVELRGEKLEDMSSNLDTVVGLVDKLMKS